MAALLAGVMMFPGHGAFAQAAAASPPAGAQEGAPQPGAAPGTGAEGRAPARVGTDEAEGADEDAATLPGDEAPPRRGASSPPPAPRGPSAYAGLETVLPTPAEAGHIDVVELPARDAAILSGRSSWDDGFRSLFDSFDALAAELARIGVKPAGRPLAVFVSTDEAGFSYEAMAPVAAPPADPAKAGGGVRFGKTPSGKAIRFTHKAPYDEIDATYEAITAYLDSKGIEAEDAFIEEYASDPKDPSDPTLQINIYIRPKAGGGRPAGAPEEGGHGHDHDHGVAPGHDHGPGPDAGGDAGKTPAPDQDQPPSRGQSPGEGQAPGRDGGGADPQRR
ncbi:GyrI-like domain-containing protein [Camelimonas abortus]|uniref:GyrI-like domain-containing protein n=1 Tax=Camelimonas abortus TaxID=1017184 RepID=A0ABV7LD56_9HYPH